MLFRNKTRLDGWIGVADSALRTLAAPANAARVLPRAMSAIGSSPLSPLMSDAELRHSAGLMRVNHVGEVCAQALYNAQSLFARSERVKIELAQAAAEEMDHLAWTQTRLSQLHASPSLLNPVWYATSFAIGAAAAAISDRVSLGFVAETEAQVEAHLASHGDEANQGGLPNNDHASRAIVAAMQADEARHGEQARQLGATALPAAVKQAMRLSAKVMTTLAYRI